MTPPIVFLVSVLGFALGCGAVAPTSTPAPDAGVPVVVPADAPPAPPPDAPTPTTWVSELYDGHVRPSSEGWTQVDHAGVYGRIFAAPDWNGAQLETDSTHWLLALAHPLVSRQTLALQVNYRWPSNLPVENTPIGPRIRVDDPTAPLGFWYESGLEIQVGDRRGEAIVFAGSPTPGVGWADASQWIDLPDYGPETQGTMIIRVDAAGHASVDVAGHTLYRNSFTVGTRVVIGDDCDAPGADFSMVLQLVLQFEPPGGVKL